MKRILLLLICIFCFVGCMISDEPKQPESKCKRPRQCEGYNLATCEERWDQFHRCQENENKDGGN